VKLLGIICEDFDEIDQILFTYSAFLRVKKWKYIMSFKRAYDSVTREVQHYH